MDSQAHGRQVDEWAQKNQVVREERFELLHHVDSLMEPVMVGLGLVLLVLLLIDSAHDFWREPAG